MSIFRFIAALILTGLVASAAPANLPPAATRELSVKTNGIIASPVNFFQANIIPGDNMTIVTNGDGRIVLHSAAGTGMASTNGLASTNYVQNATAVSVKWGDYGAKGDSSQNDAIPIQNALDNAKGRKVYLPSGTYRIDTMLKAPGGTHLVGDSATSILYYDDNFVRPSGGYNMYGFRNEDYSPGYNSNTVDAITIENVVFLVRQTQPNKVAFAVSFANVNGVTLKNCQFIVDGTASACSLDFYNSYRNVRVQDCYIENTSGTANGSLWFRGVDGEFLETKRNEDILVDGCTIYQRATHDILFVGCKDSITRRIKVNNNTFIGRGVRIGPCVAFMGSDYSTGTNSFVQDWEFIGNIIDIDDVGTGALKLGFYGKLLDGVVANNIIYGEGTNGNTAAGIYSVNRHSISNILIKNNLVKSKTLFYGIYNVPTNCVLEANDVIGDYVAGSYVACTAPIKGGKVDGNHTSPAIYDCPRVTGVDFFDCKYTAEFRNTYFGAYYLSDCNVYGGPNTLGHIVMNQEYGRPILWSAGNKVFWTNSACYLYNGTNGTVFSYYDMATTNAGSINPAASNITVTLLPSAGGGSGGSVFDTITTYGKRLILGTNNVMNIGGNSTGSSINMWPSARHDFDFRMFDGPEGGEDRVMLFRRMTNGTFRFWNYTTGSQTNGAIQFILGLTPSLVATEMQTNGNVSMPQDVFARSLTATNSLTVKGNIAASNVVQIVAGSNVILEETQTPTNKIVTISSSGGSSGTTYVTFDQDINTFSFDSQ